MNVPCNRRNLLARGQPQRDYAQEVSDPQIPENNGCYHVAFRNGKAEAVEKGNYDPDIRLTIPAFSALISGAGSLNWLSGVEIRKDTPAIRQVIHRKPMMIADYF